MILKLLLLIFQNSFSITEFPNYSSRHLEKVKYLFCSQKMTNKLEQLQTCFIIACICENISDQMTLRKSAAVFCSWVIYSLRCWSFLLKFELCFYICQKLLKKYGMRDWSITKSNRYLWWKPTTYQQLS